MDRSISQQNIEYYICPSFNRQGTGKEKKIVSDSYGKFHKILENRYMDVSFIQRYQFSNVLWLRISAKEKLYITA